MDKPYVLVVETKKGVFQELLSWNTRDKPWKIKAVTDIRSAVGFVRRHDVAVVVIYCGEDPDSWQPFLTWLKGYESVVIRLSVAAQEAQTDPALVEIHPILAANCSPRELVSAIDRGFQAWAWLQERPMMEALLAELRYLPSPPSLYFALREEINSPGSDLRRVAALLARDASLVARLLRVANSGFYARPRQITNLQEAVGLLGLDLVLGIVLSAHLFDHLPAPGLNLEELWKHNFAVAGMAQHIARMKGCSPELINAAGLAGLLHDLGSLVLLANLPGSYPGLIRKSQADERQLIQLERKQWGGGHAEVGAMVLSLWNISDLVVEAVALHHDLDADSFHQAQPVTQAVFVSELLVNEFTNQTRQAVTEDESDILSIVDPTVRSACAPMLAAALK